MKEIKNLIRKYNTFIKYILSAGLSFLIDLTLFTIFNSIFKLTLESYAIILATILARIISSFINYHINRNAVFKKANDRTKIDRASFAKYVTLVIVQMFVSSFAVFAIFNITELNETLIKIPVECILFIINYFIQKLFIFNGKKRRTPIALPQQLYHCLYIGLSIVTSFSLIVDLDKSKIFATSRTDTDALLYSIVAIGLYFFYKKFFKNDNQKTTFKVLSVIFTLLLIFGYSFDKTDSTFFVYGNGAFMIVSLVKFIGLYPFINTVLHLVYEYVTKLKIKDLKKNKLTTLLDEHPFIFTFLVLIICYLPYIIAYYPAIMGYDPANQIKEVMGIHNRYMDSVVLLDPNVTITNFNPVLHTLLLGNCFKLGVNIGNVNLGLFLYSIIQITVMISILSYSISVLKKEKVPNKLILIIIAIYAFVPIFPFYSLSTNKDTFFSLLIMLYIIKLYQLIKYEYKFKDFAIMVLVATLLFLSRNNGIYTIFLSLPFFLILKEKRKMVLLTIVSIFLLNSCYTNVILPYFKITPTSIREALSVPFQQTAALIQKDEEIIVEKDRAVIAKILDYEKIKTSYDPELADDVKNTFNRYSTDEDLKSYFNVWFKYLIKRPVVYIDATINNMYGYFYPNTSRWYLYYEYNTKLEEAGFDYHYNDLSLLRNVLSSYGNAFQYTPVLGLFVNIGFTVWVYMYLVGALIVNKNKKMILILLPALSLILVCVASPANAYFRYALPYIMSLPMTLALLYQNKKH